MNILKIDTSNNLKTRVELRSTVLEEKRRYPSEQNVLELIEKVLKKEKLKTKDIESIQVNTGPGSFTGLRVGVSIANALSFVLGVPVNDKKVGEIETPQYESLANV